MQRLFGTLLPLTLLCACTATPTAPLTLNPSWPIVFLDPWPLFSAAQADSVAQRFGCVTSFSDGGYHDGSLRPPLPVSPRYVNLRSGRIPGLWGRLQADSLEARVHDPPQLLQYRTQYPVFRGARATSKLQRAVDQLFATKNAIAQARSGAQGPLYSAAAPIPIDPEQADFYREDEEGQQEWSDVVGAYSFASDTVLSIASSRYATGHGQHGYGSVDTRCFSLTCQREVEATDLFRPELARIMGCIAAAQELAAVSEQYTQAWRARQHPLHNFSAYEPGPTPARFFEEWRHLSQQQERLRAQVQQFRAGGAGQVSVPANRGQSVPTSTWLSPDEGNRFYFEPRGVVFCLGEDLRAWEILLPYAILPRYLRRAAAPHATNYAGK